jgi:hypothetical protein
MGSRKEKVREVGIEPTETVAYSQRRSIKHRRLSTQSVRSHFARKGRPSLRSDSPFFSWARGEWLPFKVAYFVPVCKRAGIGLSLSCLYHPSFGWRGEFLISLVVTSIVAGQVPSLLGQVHPGASSFQCSQLGLPPTYALDRLSSPFMSVTSMVRVDDKQVSLAVPRGITKPPRVWRYDVVAFHVGDL